MRYKLLKCKKLMRFCLSVTRSVARRLGSVDREISDNSGRNTPQIALPAISETG